ncbi:MAG: NEW3 domain-containing protein [Nitrososphaerales archaeon]
MNQTKSEHFKHKTIALLFMLLFATLLAPLSYLSASSATTFTIVSAVWGTPANPTIVYPGDQKVKLSIVVQNTGGETYNTITPLLYPLGPPFSSESGSYDQAVGTTSKSTLTSGDYATFEFTLNIDRTATPGTYLRHLLINYRAAGTQYSTTLSFSVQISPIIKFKVLQTVWGSPSSPAVVEPGDKGATLSVVLQNTAPHAVYALSGSLYLNYPFNHTSKIDTTSFVAATLLSGATATATFTLDIAKDAPTGTYWATLTINYLDHWNTSLSQNITFQIYLPGKSTFILTPISTALTLGEEGKLTFLIKNNGSAAAYKLSITLTTPTGINLDPSQSTQYLYEIPAKASYLFDVDVKVAENVVPGVYQAQITLSYTDAYGSPVSKTYSIGIVVNASPSPKVDVVSYSWGASLTLPAHPGDRNVPLQIVIQNLNPYTITNINTKLLLTHPFYNSTRGSVCVAPYPSLQPGQAATLSFYINIAEDVEPSLYTSNLSITYRDPSATEHTVKRILQLPITNPQQFYLLNSLWGSPSNPEPAAPGDKSALLTLILRNTQTYQISSINATLHLKKPFTNTTGGSVAVSYSDATVAAGATFTLQYLLNIDEDTSVGNYTLTLRLSYIDLWSTRQQQIIPVNVVLTGRGKITVTPLSTEFYIGSTNRLALEITNVGSASVLNPSITLTPPSSLPIVVDPLGATQYFNEIAPNKAVIYKVNASLPNTATAGLYQATLTISYKDVYGKAHTDVKSIGLTVQSKPASFRVVDAVWGSPDLPILAAPGDKSITLSVTIQNCESYTISGLSSKLYLPDSFTNTTGGSIASAYYPSTIPPSQYATLKFTLNVNANATLGFHKFVLIPQYVEQGSLKQAQNVSVIVLLPGRAELEVEADKQRLILGAENTIIFRIKNSGTAAAKDLQITLTPPSNIILLSTEDATKALEVGEVTTLRARIFVPQNIASGSGVVFTLRLSYLCANLIRSEEKVLSFITSSSSSSSGLLNVRTASSSLVSGSVNDVDVQITNNLSRPIQNITATLSSPSASMLVDKAQYSEVIQPKQTIRLKFSVTVPKSVGDSNILFQLSLNYLDEQWNTYNDIYTFTLPVKEWSSPITLSANSTVLKSGSTNNPLILIKNIGSQPLSSVEVSFTSASTTLSILPESAKWFFPSIDAQAAVQAKPKIFASLLTTDSLESVVASLSYFDWMGNWRKESYTIIFSVQGSIIISFQNMQSTPSSTQPGGNITITGNVLNKGNRQAYYATVSLKASQPFQPILRSQYIGDISVNTPIPFSLTATVGRNVANGTYPITVVLEYEDSYGSKYSSEYTLQVTVTRITPQTTQPIASQTQELLTTLRTVFLTALAVIVAGGVFSIIRAYRRRRHASA